MIDHDLVKKILGASCTHEDYIADMLDAVAGDTIDQLILETSEKYQISLPAAAKRVRAACEDFIGGYFD